MKNKINSAISYLGGRFGFDAHYFIKNTFWLLMGQSLISFSAFISTVALANLVSKHDVGDFRLIISLYATLAFFTLPGLSFSLTRSMVRGFEGGLKEAFAIKMRYGIIAFFVGAVSSLYFVYQGNISFAVLVLLTSFFLPIIELFSIYVPYLQGKHEFKYSSLNTGIVKVASSLAVACSAYFYPSTLYIILAYFGAQIVVTISQYKYLTKRFPAKNSKEDKDMLPYARHMTFSGIAGLIFGQSDKFILYHFFGPVSLASYWIASTIPQEVGRFVSTVSQAAYPKFVQSNHEQVKLVLRKKLLHLTFLLVGIAFIYSLVAYPFFYLFFPDYLNEVSISIVLMFAFAIIPHLLVWQYFAAQGRHKIIYMSNTVDPVLQVFLYTVLIPFFGIWGLVAAVCIKTLCMNILAWYMLTKY